MAVILDPENKKRAATRRTRIAAHQHGSRLPSVHSWGCVGGLGDLATLLAVAPPKGPSMPSAVRNYADPQSLSEERFAERQCAGLGNDGLVQVEKGRGAGSRSGASRCLRWGLPLGGRVGDGHRPSIGRQLDRPATLFPNRSIDYRCCREVKSIYTAQAVLSIASGTCVTAHCHVYSKHYSAIAEGVSVRPPGADARRPSPPPPPGGGRPFWQPRKRRQPGA